MRGVTGPVEKHYSDMCCLVTERLEELPSSRCAGRQPHQCPIRIRVAHRAPQPPAPLNRQATIQVGNPPQASPAPQLPRKTKAPLGHITSHARKAIIFKLRRTGPTHANTAPPDSGQCARFRHAVDLELIRNTKTVPGVNQILKDCARTAVGKLVVPLAALLVPPP
jgi:hypothetical protein